MPKKRAQPRRLDTRSSGAATVNKSAQTFAADGRVRMEDVAKAAGVALVTVSRAINTPDKLAPETLAAIRRAISELGYVPNLTAGSLASNRSHVIGVTVPTLSNALFAETVDGLSEVLAAEGYQLLIGQTNYRQSEESKLVDAFLGRRVDGIVLTGVHHNESVRTRLKQAGIPVVETWDLTTRPIGMLAGFSNKDTGTAVAAYLIDKGYRSLGYIGTAEERSSKRLKSYAAEADRRGCGPVEVELVRAPSTIDDGARALAALLARRPATRAIFCSNDNMALGALLECRRQNLPVPGRMAVMGFSDVPVAAASVPALTTVQVQRKQMGIHAGNMLLSTLSGSAGGAAMTDLGFRIIERESA